VSTQGATTAVINTAYIERLQATFRSRLAPLVRRTRAAGHVIRRRAGGGHVAGVGTLYNFCCAHRSLRLVGDAAAERRWVERTPAQAAGLTDHRWSL
jgi:hypothetical protein